VVRTHRNQRVRRERLDPVLLPKQIEESSVQRRLEDRDLERVVLVCVSSEVGDLVDGDGLVRRGLRGSVALFVKRDETRRKQGRRLARDRTAVDGGENRGAYFRVGSERSDVDLSGGDGSVGIDLRRGGEEEGKTRQFERLRPSSTPFWVVIPVGLHLKPK